MANLIPLSLILFSTLTFASGHHRGEEDIELSPRIMEFLSEFKKNAHIKFLGVSDINCDLPEIESYIMHVEIDIPEIQNDDPLQ